MSNANCKITAELISDYAAGRLDAEDVQVIEEAINRDKERCGCRRGCESG